MKLIDAQAKAYALILKIGQIVSSFSSLLNIYKFLFSVCRFKGLNGIFRLLNCLYVRNKKKKEEEPYASKWHLKKSLKNAFSSNMKISESASNINQKRFSWDLIDYPRDFRNTNKKFVMEF